MESARVLKAAWQERGQSRLRDLFIASHVGWDDPDAWRAQAVKDVDHLLTDIDRQHLAQVHACELGCGVGRLTGALAPMVKSYTGVDIAPAMLEEARRRTGHLDNVRFLEGDGMELPPAACDREYGLVFASAVFIHCPRDVIEANMRSMRDVAAPRGDVRFHLRADVEDGEGLIEAPVAAQVIDDKQLTKELDLKAVVGQAGEEALIEENYMGHPFRYREAQDLVQDVFGEDGAVLRLSRGFMAAGWTRPE